MKCRIHLLLLMTLNLFACGGENTSPASLSSPVAARDALSTFQIEEGFKIELVAAEPLIADPVAMEIDENGNMYVVENHGYPLDKQRNSKVKMLRDTDGDGVMDESSVFADTLMMPTGVMRWKKGIIVTDAPDVLYMEDTDQDGKADIIKPLISGFALSNPQHNVNTPIFGLDNWIYIAHERTVGTEVYKKEFGDTGGEIFFPDKPESSRLPQNANGRNVRVRPDSYELEMLSATTQYGHSFDEWGNYFLANNSNHFMHSVISAQYLNRNPKLVVPRSTSSLPDHGNAAEVFPITKTRDRQLLTDVGVMTSACGITAYTGGAFPADYNISTTFIAEPVSNIVHADRLMPKGSTFVASRIRQKKEFLASTDMWFRPVNMYVGPDGGLYVVDYYREIIEHPEWLANDVINSGKLYNGVDMGRIYKVSAKDAKVPSMARPLPGKATDHQLVEMLKDPNLWWRRTAQRLIVDRNAQSVVHDLESLARNSESPMGRLHALWTLEGLGRLNIKQIEQALRDPRPGIRMNAVKLAELHLKEYPALAEALVSMQDDDDAKVRFQLLCTLGSINSDDAALARNKLLFRDIGDEFVQVAALSAESVQTQALLDSVLARYQANIPAYESLLQNLAAMIMVEDKSRPGYTLLRKATSSASEANTGWQVALLKGIARGHGGNAHTFSKEERDILLQTFFQHPSVPVRHATLQVLQASKPLKGTGVEEAFDKARAMATDDKSPERVRILAIDFLALRNPQPFAALLKALIRSPQPVGVKLAAIRTLNAIPDETVTDFTMENWAELEPAVQDAALNTFMEKESRVLKLVNALESGKIDPAVIGWQRSIRLMTQRNIELRNRARTFFVKDDRRQKAIEEYQVALGLDGDPERGRQVYQRSCAICHQIKGKGGVAFGPDLGTIQSWPASGIMANIINPNQSIAYGYDLWNIVLKNGASYQAVIADETPSSMTLREANGQVTTVARDEIVSQKALNMSAMPVGLEKGITQQEMADLLAYLRDGK